MRKIAFVFLLTLGLISSFSSTLTLKASAVVTGQYVTLYDLAATFDGVSIKRLKEFIVAFAPQPGESYTLDADSVKIRAQNEIKWLRVFEKSKKIKISSRVYVVDLSLIHNALEDKIGKTVFLTSFPTVKISDQNCSVEVKSISEIANHHFALVKISQDKMSSYVNVGFETTEIGTCESVDDIKKVILKSEKKGLSLSLVNSVPSVKYDFIEIGKPFKSSIKTLKVPVNFVSRSGVFSTVLEYRLSLYENVVVAAKRIPYGKKISENDLLLKKMDVYATSTTFATSLKACVGMISIWSFERDQVISLNGLKSPPDVVTGEILIAYISYPTMTVTTFVRAMQNGNIGQVIAVRNVSNGYMFYGTVEKGPKICVYSGGE